MIKTLLLINFIFMLSSCALLNKSDSLSPPVKDLSINSIAIPFFQNLKNASSPRLSSTDNGILLSWVETTDTQSVLKFSMYQQQQWSLPKTVAQSSQWFINYADYAKVTPLSERHFVASWLEYMDGSSFDYRFMVSQSFDAGSTWSALTYPNFKSPLEKTGFVSFALEQEKIVAVWISSNTKDVYAVKSAALDARNEWGEISTIDASTCSCCHTNISKIDDKLLLVYRDRSDEQIRDIALSVYEKEHWSKPEIVHHDGWEINGCPVNGPVVTSTLNHTAIAWFTFADDKPRIKLKVSNRTDESSIYILDDKSPYGFVDIVQLDENHVAVSWLTEKNGNNHIAIQVINLATQHLFEAIYSEADNLSRSPSITAYKDTLFIASLGRDRSISIIKKSYSSLK